MPLQHRYNLKDSEVYGVSLLLGLKNIAVPKALRKKAMKTLNRKEEGPPDNPWVNLLGDLSSDGLLSVGELRRISYPSRPSSRSKLIGPSSSPSPEEQNPAKAPQTRARRRHRVLGSCGSTTEADAELSRSQSTPALSSPLTMRLLAGHQEEADDSPGTLTPAPSASPTVPKARSLAGGSSLHYASSLEDMPKGLLNVEPFAPSSHINTQKPRSFQNPFVEYEDGEKQKNVERRMMLKDDEYLAHRTRSLLKKAVQQRLSQKELAAARASLFELSSAPQQKPNVGKLRKPQQASQSSFQSSKARKSSRNGEHACVKSMRGLQHLIKDSHEKIGQTFLDDEHTQLAFFLQQAYENSRSRTLSCSP